MKKIIIDKAYIKQQAEVCPQYARLIKDTIKRAGGTPLVESETESDYCIIPFSPYFLPPVYVPKIHCKEVAARIGQFVLVDF